MDERKIKSFLNEGVKAEEDGYIFNVSVEVVDRDNEVLLVDGADLTNYEKNKIVLFNHDLNKVIGKALWLKKTKDTPKKLIAKISFATTEFAQEIKKLVDEGVLNAVSIRFIPKSSTKMKEFGDATVYDKWELLEISIVSVGANPEALREKMKSLNISQTMQNFIINSIEKKVISYKKYPFAPDDYTWDAGKETRDADVEDLRIMCTWYDEEKPDNKTSYKLPHHRRSDKYVVWRGVTAAMAALMGARGGVDIPDSDRRGVYEHLAKHYEDHDSEPPEFKSVEFFYKNKEFIDPSHFDEIVDMICKNTDDEENEIKKEIDEISKKVNEIEKILKELSGKIDINLAGDNTSRTETISFAEEDIKSIIKEVLAYFK
jgi:HK97 family phage prohead protease